MNNRIKKYLQVEPEKEAMAKCVIISDEQNNRVVLSHEGHKLIWYWVSSEDETGLKIPGMEGTLNLHPLAVEAYITEEIQQFLDIEHISKDEVITVNSVGAHINGVKMSPPELGKIDFEIMYKKEMIKELYSRYLENGGMNEEIVNEAIGCDVLKPLLTLTNMEL